MCIRDRSKLDLNGAKYDSIISMKINNSSEIGIYEIKPESKIYFYQLYGVNTKPQKHILYDEAKIIKSNDTISLNKENIKAVSYTHLDVYKRQR